MSLNMSTNTAASAANRAMAALTAPPPAPAAPAAGSKTPGAAASKPQAGAGNTSNSSKTQAQSGARKPDGSAAAARPTAPAPGQPAQPAADTAPAAQSSSNSAAANTAQRPAPAALQPPLFAHLLDLAAQAPAADSEDQASASEREEQSAGADDAAQDNLAAMLPSFAVLPLPTGAGAQQDEGGGQHAAQDDGTAAGVTSQLVSLQDGQLFPLSSIANAAALQAAQASAAANSRAAQADSALQAAANAMTAQQDATAAVSASADAPGASAARGTSGLQADAAEAGIKAGLKPGETAATAIGSDTHGFRSVLAANAGSAPAGDSVKLAGNPEQWQQPLRAALGDRLQLQLQRNSEQAVIRLEPPNLGSIEISIRHSAGALQVSLSASNSEVLRQLNNIGDTMRQDLSQRQFTEVAVTVSASAGRGLADGSGNGRQERQQQERGPGRALNEDNDSSTNFAMQSERE